MYVGYTKFKAVGFKFHCFEKGLVKFWAYGGEDALRALQCHGDNSGIKNKVRELLSTFLDGVLLFFVKFM